MEERIIVKKFWMSPEIESINVAQTANNVIVSPVEDGVKEGELGGNPQGYECEVDCS